MFSLAFFSQNSYLLSANACLVDSLINVGRLIKLTSKDAYCLCLLINAGKQTNQCSEGWLKRESLPTTKLYKVYAFDLA